MNDLRVFVHNTRWHIWRYWFRGGHRSHKVGFKKYGDTYSLWINFGKGVLSFNYKPLDKRQNMV